MCGHKTQGFGPRGPCAPGCLVSPRWGFSPAWRLGVGRLRHRCRWDGRFSFGEFQILLDRWSLDCIIACVINGYIDDSCVRPPGWARYSFARPVRGPDPRGGVACGPAATTGAGGRRREGYGGPGRSCGGHPAQNKANLARKVRRGTALSPRDGQGQFAGKGSAQNKPNSGPSASTKQTLLRSSSYGGQAQFRAGRRRKTKPIYRDMPGAKQTQLSRKALLKQWIGTRRARDRGSSASLRSPRHPSAKPVFVPEGLRRGKQPQFARKARDETKPIRARVDISRYLTSE